MTTPTEIPSTPSPEVTSDDKLWVVLSFLFTPLFPLITLFMDDKKNRPFIKYHNIPILIFGVAEAVICIIFSFIPIVACLGGLLWIINIIYAVKANNGTQIDIPVITEFSKGRGWS
jgi:uncharacterized protein